MKNKAERQKYMYERSYAEWNYKDLCFILMRGTCDKDINQWEGILGRDEFEFGNPERRNKDQILGAYSLRHPVYFKFILRDQEKLEGYSVSLKGERVEAIIALEKVWDKLSIVPKKPNKFYFEENERSVEACISTYDQLERDAKENNERFENLFRVDTYRFFLVWNKYMEYSRAVSRAKKRFGISDDNKCL